jgi:hypothetical protein
MRGLTRYVGMHFQKESQAPPKGFPGQRFRASRGYFATSRTELRERARESLRAGRRIWKAERLAWDRVEVEVERAGHEPDSSDARWLRGFLVDEGLFEEWQAEHLAELKEADGLRSWELVEELRRVLPEGGSVVTGYRAVRGGGGPRRAGSARRVTPDPVKVAAMGGYTGTRGVEVEGSDGRSLRVPVVVERRAARTPSNSEATVNPPTMSGGGAVASARGSGGEPPGVPKLAG